MAVMDCSDKGIILQLLWMAAGVFLVTFTVSVGALFGSFGSNDSHFQIWMEHRHQRKMLELQHKEKCERFLDKGGR